MSLHVPSSCTYCFHVLFPRIGWHRSTPSVSIDRRCMTKVLHACCRQRSKAKRENKPTTKSASNTNQSNGVCSSNTCCRSPLCIVDHRIECNAHNHARNHMYSHRVMLHTCTHVRFNMCELIDSTWHPIARVINLACMLLATLHWFDNFLACWQHPKNVQASNANVQNWSMVPHTCNRKLSLLRNIQYNRKPQLGTKNAFWCTMHQCVINGTIVLAMSLHALNSKALILTLWL